MSKEDYIRMIIEKLNKISETELLKKIYIFIKYYT